MRTRLGFLAVLIFVTVPSLIVAGMVEGLFPGAALPTFCLSFTGMMVVTLTLAAMMRRGGGNRRQ